MVRRLFTAATDAQVSYLARNPEWEAHVFPNLYHDRQSPWQALNSCDRDGRPTLPRKIQPVRLLQVDMTGSCWACRPAA